MMMNRRGLMGIVAALALAAFTGVSADAADTEVQATCACCGDACVCPSCVCDPQAGDCCECCDCCTGCDDAECCSTTAETTANPAVR